MIVKNDDWILIGCPVYKREWILPTWFERIENQSWSHKNVGFIFECAPDDKETLALLFRYREEHPYLRAFDIGVHRDQNHTEHIETTGPDGVTRKMRRWTPTRYKSMINFRNSLLSRVQDKSPARYFSLDSDILLDDPDTLRKMFEFTAEPGHDAASPLCYMTPETIDFPNAMTWVKEPGSPAFRDNYPIGDRFQADVIMAAVMMTEPVYRRSYYVHHRLGEDLGWSKICSQQNFKLWVMSDIYASHMMFKDDFGKYLKNGDVRLPKVAERYPNALLLSE